MGADQSSHNVQGRNPQSQSQNLGVIPELRIKTESWIRESHGLYDYEGTELDTLTFSLKGNQRFQRSESKVTVQAVTNDQLEEDDKNLPPEEKEKIICRFFFKDNSYWIYHKNLVDETIDQVLERKPEEKIWQVVKSIHNEEMEFPCYKIQKRDLIKVGRVRFKIRDLMSPVYKKIAEQHKFLIEKFQMNYPSFEESVLESSMDQSQALISGGNAEPIKAESPRVSNFNRMADQTRNLASMDGIFVPNHDPNVNTQPIAFAGLNLNQVSPDDDLGFDQTQVVGFQRDNFILPPILEHMQIGHLSVLEEEVDRLMGQGSPTLLLDRKITVAPEQQHERTKIKLQKDVDGLSNFSKKEVPVCRICLMEENEVSNPLFSPCKCSGSMKYIHHMCLKTWFQGKRIMKVSPVVTTYFWKNLECELCKTPYPYETKSLDGKEWLNIIEYDTPVSLRGEDIYYIVLESISSNTSKVIHVVNMEKTQKLYIGRGHDAHVRVTDISVSRLHAVLIKSNQGFYYLTDNESKFGTLALVKTPLEIKPQTAFELQIGRTMFTIACKKAYANIFAACLCLNKDQKSKSKTVNDTDCMLSLNGIEYFPKEFVTQEFQESMKKRKALSSKRISQKILKNQRADEPNPTLLARDTQQDEEEALENVDEFIAMQIMNNEQIRQRNIAAIQESQDFVMNNSNFEMDRASDQEDEYEEEVEEEEQEDQEQGVPEAQGHERANDPEGRDDQSDSSEEDAQEIRRQQLEQAQLEEAIEQSLNLQRKIERQQKERQELERSQAQKEQHTEQRFGQDNAAEEMKIDTSQVLHYDDKHTACLIPQGLEQQQDLEIASNMSTSRVSQAPLFEFKSKLQSSAMYIKQPGANHIQEGAEEDARYVDQSAEVDDLSDSNMSLSLMQAKQRLELTPKPRMLQNSDRGTSPLELGQTSKSRDLSLSLKPPLRLQTTRAPAIREIIGEEDQEQDTVAQQVSNIMGEQPPNRNAARLEMPTLDEQFTAQQTEVLSAQHTQNVTQNEPTK